MFIELFNFSGGEWMCVCVCVAEYCCYARETVTILLIALQCKTKSLNESKANIKTVKSPCGHIVEKASYTTLADTDSLGCGASRATGDHGVH